MEVDNYGVDFGRLNSLVHFEPQPMEDLIEEIIVDMNNVKLSTKKYKKYGADKIERFISRRGVICS
jgi:hypothetical protein